MQIKYIPIEIPYILKKSLFEDNDFIKLKSFCTGLIWDAKNIWWIIVTLKFNGYKNEIAFIK